MRLPIVVISGFLGAGKTTLLNHVVQHPAGRKLGVIVNDVDSLNIDAELIQATDGNEITLSNGCICCSLQQDLVTSVKTLAESEPKLDAILVETSGVTDPLSLALAIRLLEDREVARLETLVYLVDAANFDQLDFEDGETVLSHAAISDLILLTKGDLIDSEELSTRIERITAALRGQPVIPVNVAGEPGRVNLDWFFSPSFTHPRQHLTETPHHHYQSWSRQLNGYVDRARFEAFLQRVAESAWRSKGLVTFTDQPDQRYLCNQVGMRASLEKWNGKTSALESGSSAMVVLYKPGRLSKNWLDAEFRQLGDGDEG